MPCSISRSAAAVARARCVSEVSSSSARQFAGNVFFNFSPRLRSHHAARRTMTAGFASSQGGSRPTHHDANCTAVRTMDCVSIMWVFVRFPKCRLRFDGEASAPPPAYTHYHLLNHHLNLLFFSHELALFFKPNLERGVTAFYPGQVFEIGRASCRARV